MGLTNPTSHSLASIDELIQFLSGNKILTSAILSEKLHTLDFRPQDFLPLAQADHDIKLSYGRTKLHEADQYVIFLMTWAKGDYTAIHSHGLTEWGAVVFLGPVDHRLYTLNESGELLLASHSEIKAGTIVPVSGELIHSMGNQADSPSLSIHIYGSGQQLNTPNTTSRIYEPEKQRIRITHGEAYIGGEQSIQPHLPLKIANQETLTDWGQILMAQYQRMGDEAMVEKLNQMMK